MHLINISLLILLINLAFAYRLERRSLVDPNTTSILKEEIAELRDNEDNYQPWREWPNRLFPRYHTVSDLNRPTWTLVTKSKTILPTESAPLTTPALTQTDSSSTFESSKSLLSPTVPDFTSETSSTLLPSVSELTTTIQSSTIQSSFSDITSTPSTSFADFETTFPNLISSTPSVPFSSLSSISEDTTSSTNDDSIDRTDYEAISSTSTIHSTIHQPESTVHFNQTDEPILTTQLPILNDQHLHKTVLSLPPEAFRNLSIDYENSLAKVFELAYSRLNDKNASNFQVKLKNSDWKKEPNSTILTLVYSVKVDKKYLNNDEIKQLLAKMSDQEMANMLDANLIISKAEPFERNPTNEPTATEIPDIKLSELFNSKILNIDGPYFWIFVGLVFFIMLICCFYFGMLVCWWKNRRSKKSKFSDNTFKDNRDLNQFSPAHSDYSSDTLNTENFIRWRSKPGSKQKLNKRTKSLFKDDFKSSSLSKLTRRKELGSSPSNEFEYISFSSDTTNSSLQRDGSLNKKSSVVRHHPYIGQEQNRNSNPNYNRNLTNRNSTRDLKTNESDYQQDYQQEYHIPTIERTATNSLNQPNGIKLLISRGIQNNLLTANDYTSNQQSSIKKYPLEIPFNNYYGNHHVSVLNLSKEKLIPLNQYTSDSSSTTTSISKDEKSRIDSRKQADQQFRVDSRFEPRIESRSESRSSEPKRLIRKETIEEFETITTTTTFKNSNRNSPNLTSGDVNAKMKDAQLNEQTKTIINAIRDELKRFNQQPVHIEQFKKLDQ